MRKLLVLFTFSSLLLLVFSQKLSSEEDSQRFETCGTLVKTKVLTGTAADDSAPWTMRITSKSAIFSAILISERHLITAGLAVMKSKNGTNNQKWEWVSIGKQVDINKCKDNELKVPDEVLSSMRVELSVCQDEDKCGTKISRAIKNAHYFGHCETGLPPFGIVLIEMDLGVPQQAPYFVPACVFKSHTTDDDDVTFYSAGDPITSDPKKSIIKSTPSKVQKCKSWSYDQSMCATHVACAGDFGGGLVKSINGKSTVVGISYGPDNPQCAPAQSDHLVAVEHYLDKLCDYAGVCETTPPEVESGAFASSKMLLAVVLILGMFQ